MQIKFRADNAFTRKHARLIWRQFFPDYLQAMGYRWILILVMAFAVFEIISLLRADDQAEWLSGWGLPDSFADWPYGPLSFIIAVCAVILLAEVLLRRKSRRAEAQFASIAPPEEATFSVSETELAMQSESAKFEIPLGKLTGLAVSKQALAIGFSGSGMIIPRSAFATPAEETAFVRALARGMREDAVQRSSQEVQKMVSAEKT